MPSSDCGILYVATGADYVEEANESAVSFRRQNPELPLAIATDRPDVADKGLFAHVFTLENPSGNFFDKIHGMLLSPFARTAFIDTDAYAADSISDLFRILEKFDLAVAYDPIRSDFVQEDIPDSFPTPNTGVIAYQNTPVVREFLNEWLDAYQWQMTLPVKPGHDQPAFRRALYFSKLRFTILPDEWNLRVIFPHLIGGNSKVKIIHGRHEHREHALRLVGTMTYHPRVVSRDFSIVALLQMLVHRIKLQLQKLSGPGGKPDRRGVTGKN